MKKTAPPYTGGTLILSFLQGCGRWFTAGLLLALGLTLSEMLIPQILRFTVDSVIGKSAARRRRLAGHRRRRTGAAAASVVDRRRRSSSRAFVGALPLRHKPLQRPRRRAADAAYA